MPRPNCHAIHSADRRLLRLWASLIPFLAAMGCWDARIKDKPRPSPSLHVHLKSVSQKSLRNFISPPLQPSGCSTSILEHSDTFHQERMIVLEKAWAGCGDGSAIRGGTMVHLGYSEFGFSLRLLMQCPYSHQTLLKHLTGHSEALIRGHNGAWLVLAGMD